MRRNATRSLLCPALILSIFLASCGSSGLTYTPEPVVRDDVHFSDLPFYFPKAGDLKQVLQKFQTDMALANSGEEQIKLMLDLDKEFRMIGDMRAIARIRFSQNVSDETQAGYMYFVQLSADLADEWNLANIAVTDSKYVKQLETYFSKDVIAQYRAAVREFDPARAEISAQLADLQTQYIQKASEKTSGVSLTDEMNFQREADSLFNEMLQLREEQARLAGYDSFNEYGYSHSSFSLEDAEAYIKNIKHIILPVYQKLADNAHSQQDRCPASALVELDITYDESNYYERLYDVSIRTLRAALDEMNPLIDYVERNGLIDAMPRENKENGAYLRPLMGIQVPFIYMDGPWPDSIFHEFGHALEVFEWPKIDLQERFNVTSESAEISSKCMEVLVAAQYEILFGDTAGYARMENMYALTNHLLYAAMLCEFELELYKTPVMTQRDRSDLFKELLREYRMELYPWTDMQHYFTSPHYVVGYSFASVAAIELLQVMQNDLQKAKDMYLHYIRDNARHDFVKRLGNAGFGNPFERQTLEDLARFLDDLFTSDEYLNPGQLRAA